jgi:hypothetical protein
MIMQSKNRYLNVDASLLCVNSIYLNLLLSLTKFSTNNIICIHTALILLISYVGKPNRKYRYIQRERESIVLLSVKKKINDSILFLFISSYRNILIGLYVQKNIYFMICEQKHIRFFFL